MPVGLRAAVRADVTALPFGARRVLEHQCVFEQNRGWGGRDEPSSLWALAVDSLIGTRVRAVALR
jgi:hypothetical protein